MQSNLSKTFTIGNIYRSPRTRNEDLCAFIDGFTPIISKLENCNNDIVIAGDFNINLLKLNENEMFSSFFDVLISHSFYLQITLPTRFTRTTGTLIDNLFCRLHESIHTAGILTKGKFLYSAVSSPQDRSKCFTLYFPDRPIHLNTISASLGSIQPYATINARRLLVHISTTVYSQVLIYTAE